MALVRKVTRVIEQEKLIKRGERVLVALSGGIDSVTLLYVLNEIRQALSFDCAVAHVNHLLRGNESQRDEDFAKSLAEKFSFPYHSHRVDVKSEAKRAGKSIQHAARDVRYSFLNETALKHGYQKIAVAHTLDDQVETFMLRILKGTGMRGLLAIPMRRDRIVRPFLETERKEIEEYVSANGVTFMEDSSNMKVVYERNFLRREVLPLMERLNPRFREKVLLLLKDLAAVNGMLERRVEEFMSAEVHNGQGTISFKVKRLIALDEEIRFRVIARALSRMVPEFMPLREHMILIDKILSGSRPNLFAMLPHGLKVKKVYGDLILTTETDKASPMGVYPVLEGENRLKEFGINLHVSVLGEQDNAPPVQVSGEGLFDAKKLGRLCVRTFREGDRLVPFGMDRQVKLKNFFIAQKIPRDERRRIPLLISGNDIIWVIGYRTDDRYKVTEETRRIVRIVAEAD
jgi:tRNA(Ile)-lysidine synthase